MKRFCFAHQILFFWWPKILFCMTTFIYFAWAKILMFSPQRLKIYSGKNIGSCSRIWKIFSFVFVHKQHMFACVCILWMCHLLCGCCVMFVQVNLCMNACVVMYVYVVCVFLCGKYSQRLLKFTYVWVYVVSHVCVDANIMKVLQMWTCVHCTCNLCSVWLYE